MSFDHADKGRSRNTLRPDAQQFSSLLFDVPLLLFLFLHLGGWLQHVVEASLARQRHVKLLDAAYLVRNNAAAERSNRLFVPHVDLSAAIQLLTRLKVCSDSFLLQLTRRFIVHFKQATKCDTQAVEKFPQKKRELLICCGINLLHLVENIDGLGDVLSRPLRTCLSAPTSSLSKRRASSMSSSSTPNVFSSEKECPVWRSSIQSNIPPAYTTLLSQSQHVVGSLLA